MVRILPRDAQQMLQLFGVLRAVVGMPALDDQHDAGNRTERPGRIALKISPLT